MLELSECVSAFKRCVSVSAFCIVACKAVMVESKFPLAMSAEILFKFPVKVFMLHTSVGISSPIRWSMRVVVCARFSEITARFCTSASIAESPVMRLRLPMIESTLGSICSTAGSISAARSMAPKCIPPIMVSPIARNFTGFLPGIRWSVMLPISELSSSAVVPSGTRIALSNSIETTTALLSA